MFKVQRAEFKVQGSTFNVQEEINICGENPADNGSGRSAVPEIFCVRSIKSQIAPQKKILYPGLHKQDF